jgi:hypothetical protein
MVVFIFARPNLSDEFDGALTAPFAKKTGGAI